MISQSKALLGT